MFMLKKSVTTGISMTGPLTNLDIKKSDEEKKGRR